MLLDVHATKLARDYAEAVLETARQPLLILDKDFKILRSNKAFREVFQVSKPDTDNRLLFDLPGRQWRIPKLREALAETLPNHRESRNFEVEREVPGIGRSNLLLTAREF